jgi:hypothetical protein
MASQAGRADQIMPFDSVLDAREIARIAVVLSPVKIVSATEPTAYRIVCTMAHQVTKPS